MVVPPAQLKYLVFHVMAKCELAPDFPSWVCDLAGRRYRAPGYGSKCYGTPGVLLQTRECYDDFVELADPGMLRRLRRISQARLFLPSG